MPKQLNMSNDEKKERFKQYQKEYREKNKDKIKAYQKNYREEKRNIREVVEKPES